MIVTKVATLSYIIISLVDNTSPALINRVGLYNVFKLFTNLTYVTFNYK